MAPAISKTSAEPTLYEILSLTPKHLEGQASAAQQKAVKQAYRKALLKHHPDKHQQDSPTTSASSQTQTSPKAKSKSTKSTSSSTSVPKSQLIYTVDQIQHAYNVLSDAHQRREYDRQLLLTSSSTFTTSFSSHQHSSSSSSTQQKHSVSTRFHTGIETVDLDDLGFDERTGVYHGSCRCGNERGFQFTEAQLEEYEDDRVLMVQCLDCSLWMRVLFDAAVESEDDQEQQQQQQQTSHTNRKANEDGQAVEKKSNSSEAPERRGSHSGSATGKGWKFSFGFNWGISLGGSASATAHAGAKDRR
ncbi:hypothetical protein F5Y19DRAFT_469000 [Xylariaceae sp. FL1651]|nr:hypothetical protein F5Y19DRAFT_469000 [Xylariaceae sp. FL1651]